jgi:IPT/TIG domain
MTGSLYYIAYPNYFEVVDVLHARLLMRFSLTETVQATASPIAIDSGGRHVYLITDKGLTVVDLGQAPLAIGHLSQQTAGAGTQVAVRGSGFDASVTATVGGEPASVSITDENTLRLTVPAVASGPEDIVLVRGDGATYTYESGLTIP